MRMAGPEVEDGAHAWHALDLDAVVEELGTSAERGLAGDDATRRLEQHGRNELEQEEPKGALEILLHQFTSPLIYIPTW